MLERAVLEKAFQAFEKLRIVVVGDLMLDRYIWGKVDRISPEAPVPVIEVTEDAERPGGAGNVVLNLLTLGAKCTPIGIVGNDRLALGLLDLLESSGASLDGIVQTDERPTTVKTRIIAGQQHLVRVDRETAEDISTDVENRILEQYKRVLDDADAVILQDYNKGVLTKNVIRGTIDIARERNIPITVDPKKQNFFEFWGATLFKPNVREASRALNRPIVSDSDVERAGSELLARLQSEAVLITRGSHGMSLFSMGRSPVHIPTRAVKISDVSGAGDTVISTLTLGIAAGLKREEAAMLANQAAGYVVGQVGVVPVIREALLGEEKD